MFNEGNQVPEDMAASPGALPGEATGGIIEWVTQEPMLDATSHPPTPEPNHADVDNESAPAPSRGNQRAKVMSPNPTLAQNMLQSILDLGIIDAETLAQIRAQASTEMPPAARTPPGLTAQKEKGMTVDAEVVNNTLQQPDCPTFPGVDQNICQNMIP